MLLEPNNISAGQTIHLLLTFDTSKCKVKIGSVEVYISTLVEQFSGRIKMGAFELTTPSIKGPSVPSGLEHKVCQMSFEVPKDLPKTFKSKMIKVSHQLVVKLAFPFSSNKKLRLPFKLYGSSTAPPVDVSIIDDFDYLAPQLINIKNNANDDPPTYYAITN